MQTRFCTNIEQSPGARNNIVSTNVPNRATRDNRIGRCVKSPLKNNAAVADEFVEFIGYINLSLEAAAGSYKLNKMLALLDKPLKAQCPAQCRQRPRDISAKEFMIRMNTSFPLSLQIR
mgnify:FL=1